MKTSLALIAAFAAGLTTAVAQSGSSSSEGAAYQPETTTPATSPARSYPPKASTPNNKKQSQKAQKSTLEPEDRTSPTGTMSESSRRLLKQSRPAAVGQGSATGSGNQETINKNARQPIRADGKSNKSTRSSGGTTN